MIVSARKYNENIVLADNRPLILLNMAEKSDILDKLFSAVIMKLGYC